MRFRDEKSSAFALFVFCLALLVLGYYFIRAGNFIFYLDGRPIRFDRNDTPVEFYAATIATLVGGVLCGAIAVRKLIRPATGSTQPKQVTAHPIWGFVNVGLGIIVGLLSAMTAAASLPPIGAPIIPVTATFIMTVVLAIVSVRTADVETLSRPSWNRSPFRWSADPLQSLFMSNWFTACLLTGGGLRAIMGDRNELQFLPFMARCSRASSSDN